MIQPFFSVITASFNSEKTIFDTINSVLHLQFTDYEYIIIDGNSSDATVTIIESFVSEFENKNIRYRYISEKDLGIYDAWNKGVALSTGKWVSFLGSDDEYLNDALTNYYAQIKNLTDCNYISSQVEIVNQKKEKIAVIGKKYNWERANRDIDVAQVGSFHKKELLDAVGLFSTKYKIVGDLDFYLRCKNHIKPAYFKTITAKMENGGVSNQIYKALKEALLVKLHFNFRPKLLCYYDFYSSLLKCYIKIVIKTK
jgi:glycosyltransferase involved in cell wall biosynthesis